MTTDVPVFTGRRAILIGVSAYEYAEYPPIRAARNSMEGMRNLLSDPSLCDWSDDQITVISNPISAVDLAVQITDLAENTRDVLILYYVGHATLSPRGDLCLTVTSTRPDRSKITGLTWETVAEILRNSSARVRIAILDCCFAGRAIEALGGDAGPGLPDIAHVEGVYTLTATTRNRTAHVPPPDQQDLALTSFTGELLKLIRCGIPGKPAHLTISDIYPVLRQQLLAKGLPSPNQRGTDTVQTFVFAANAATTRGIESGTDRDNPRTGQTIPESSQPDSTEAEIGIVQTDILAANAVEIDSPLPEQTEMIGTVGLIQESLRIACSIRDCKGKILARARSLLAALNPGQAFQCLDEVLRVVYSIEEEAPRAMALLDIADLLEGTDPDRADRLRTDAERVAQSIGDVACRSEVSADLAFRLANKDPVRAARLRAETERTTQSITDPRKRLRALRNLAHGITDTDPDRANRLLGEVERELQSDLLPEILRSEAFCELAERVAGNDPDWASRLFAKAEQTADSITDDLTRSKQLCELANQVSITSSESAARLRLKAEHAVQSISNDRARSSALSDLAQEFAAIDAGSAERILMSITDVARRTKALHSIAESLAASNPERAERVSQLLASEPIVHPKNSNPLDFSKYIRIDLENSEKKITLRKVMRVLVKTDPQRAERIARSSPEASRSEALAEVAKLLAPTNPDSAERVAHSASDASLALAGVVTGLAPTDPKRAEQLARSIPNDSLKSSALVEVAYRLVDIDPEYALQISESIPGDLNSETRSALMSRVAGALATTKPNQAERIAQSIPEPDSKALALYNVAIKLANTDPRKAAGLLVEASRIEVRRLSSLDRGTFPSDLFPDGPPSPLSDIVAALIDVAPTADAAVQDEAQRAAKALADELDNVLAFAGIDPDQAERLSYSITDERSRASALRGIAELVAVTDQDRAARLRADAERADSSSKRLERMVIHYADRHDAGTFIDAAERFAQSTSPFELYKLSVTLAGSDPDRAEQIAKSITNLRFKASALYKIAMTVAAIDPGRAERVAQSLPDEAIIVAIDVVLLVGREVKAPSTRTLALRNIAQTLADTDMDRAIRVLAAAERIASSITEPAARAIELLEVAEAWSNIDSRTSGAAKR